MIRILLVDDHQIMREGLIQLLDLEPGLQVVGEAANGQQGVELARELRPDVIIMDAGMPVMSGAEATRIITAELPGITVIGLWMYDEEEGGGDLCAAGAARCLTKTAPVAVLVAAIRECRAARPKPGTP